MFFLASAEDDHRSIDINNVAFYQNVCAQLDMSSLAVNTVVQSQNVNEMEGFLLYSLIVKIK